MGVINPSKNMGSEKIDQCSPINFLFIYPFSWINGSAIQSQTAFKYV